MTTSEEIQPAHGWITSWTRRLRVSARLASDHGELWLPGALATMSSIGWLPFVLAVVPAPSDGDLAFLASAVVLSPSYPLNVVLPAIALICAVISATLLSATGEAVLVRMIARLRGYAVRAALDDDAARIWLIRLVASIPALVVGGALLAMIAAVGPGEYQSPDLGRGPLLVRIATDVWPLIAGELVAIFVGQAFALGAVQASVLQRGALRGALAAGLHDLWRYPLRRMAEALIVEVCLGVWLVVTWALLRLLWIPIGRHAQDGTLLSPVGLVLLVGFIAIWLCLVASAGVLHAWSSTWWVVVSREQVATTVPADHGSPWT